MERKQGMKGENYNKRHLVSNFQTRGKLIVRTDELVYGCKVLLKDVRGAVVKLGGVKGRFHFKKVER